MIASYKGAIIMNKIYYKYNNTFVVYPIYQFLIIFNLFILGHENVVKYLLKNGADVNKQTNCGATAMHFAAQADNIKIAKLLLAFNAQQLKNEQCI